MQKLILSLFTIVLLNAGKTAWGADKKLAKEAGSSRTGDTGAGGSDSSWLKSSFGGAGAGAATYDDSWGARHPKAIDLPSLSRLFQAYERAEDDSRATNLNNLKNSILTDLAADRLLDINRRFLIKKANRAHGITKDGPIGDKAAELARIQVFLAELS